LTARLVARRHWRAFRSGGALGQVEITSRKAEPILCPFAVTASTEALITTGSVGPIGATARFPNAIAVTTFQRPTDRSPSTPSSDACYEPNGDKVAGLSFIIAGFWLAPICREAARRGLDGFPSSKSGDCLGRGVGEDRLERRLQAPPTPPIRPGALSS
jgi:hypothetical protein